MKKIIVLLLALLMFSCQEGLQPEPGRFLNGKVIFQNPKSEWPPEDSLNEIRVVALKSFPPNDLVDEIISGNAFFTDPLPLYQDSVEFHLEIEDAPIELKYIGVAQNYGSILEWKVIGVYSETNDNEQHSSVFVGSSGSKHIEIFVDFNDLPPQPFEAP